MDSSRFGKTSKEWDAYAASHPLLDVNSDGFKDNIFPTPAMLRDAANAAKDAASMAFFARDGLGSKVSVKSHQVPTRDGSDITMRSYRPVGVDAGRAIPAYIFYHGGGMLFGTPDGEAHSCASWAHELGSTEGADPVAILHVCYRHTPENVHPCQHNDAWDAFEWIINNASALGVDPKQIVIGGVSAGGCLTASVVFREVAAAKREGRELRVKGQNLFIPWLINRDAYPLELFKDEDCASISQCASSPILPRPRYDMFTDLCQVEDPEDPLMNVGLAAEEDIKGTPRTSIVACGWDMLRDEAFIYAEKLERLGCPTKKHVFSGMPHAFRKYPDMPSSKRWDELTIEGIRWCLDDSAEGHAPGDWKVEVPEKYR